MVEGHKSYSGNRQGMYFTILMYVKKKLKIVNTINLTHEHTHKLTPYVYVVSCTTVLSNL